ncbi:MAG TPA: MFS transporter [Leptospiraceae bacterium]|nr:MFS transporter [Leptospiraceae bacterium]HMW06701.1 MFS transporter [Leptospiraceae bacterium]HMX31951.1 MFS transporter [Leptospiraceae bacterium]HMY33622.1 MFS transporter [Leptospiraceae bacterium]HMZ66454.1 MFS transporter [Leptospiraceae bacterium]
MQYKKPFFIILISWTLASFGFATILPFLSIFLSDQYGLSVSEIGIFFLLTAILRSIFQMYSGEISDLFGRKNIMSYSQIARAFLLILAVIAIYFKLSYLYVVSLVGISYVFASMFQPVAQAALADHLPIENFLQGFSLIRVAGNFAWSLGPIIAGYVTKISYSALFISSAVFSILGAILTHRHYIDATKLDKKENRTNLGTVFNDKLFLTFCLITFFLCITISQMFSSLSIYLSKYKHLDSETIGYIFAINGFTVLIFQMPISKLVTSKIKPLYGMSIGSLLYMLGYFIAGYANSLLGYILILFCVSLGEVFVTPLIQTSVAKLAPEKMIGRYMGFYSMIAVAGWSFGPYIGGKILDFFSLNFHIAWQMISLFALFASIGYFLLDKILVKTGNVREL